MKTEKNPEDLYDGAVGDGTPEPEKPKDDDASFVTESNASNYGASAVSSPLEPEEKP